MSPMKNADSSLQNERRKHLNISAAAVLNILGKHERTMRYQTRFVMAVWFASLVKYAEQRHKHITMITGVL